MKDKINNGDVLEAIKVISKHCKSTVLSDGCNNCIINQICLNVLKTKTKSIPLYWMDYITRKD